MNDTKEQLIQIMETYNIGKKPLAKLLGWGDTTIMNQLKGTNAGPEYAEKIESILVNPYLFAEMLETNHRKLTEVAYRKAKKAVEDRIKREKANHLVMYLVKYTNGDVAPYHLVATVFYAQAAELIIKGRPLFDEDPVYKPRTHIPYPELYGKLTRQEAFHYSRSTAEILTSEDKDIVVAVHKLLSGYSPNGVKKLLTVDRNGLLSIHSPEPENETEGITISISEFHEYFRKIGNEMKIGTVDDFRTYFDYKLRGRKKNDVPQKPAKKG